MTKQSSGRKAAYRTYVVAACLVGIVVIVAIVLALELVEYLDAGAWLYRFTGAPTP